MERYTHLVFALHGGRGDELIEVRSLMAVLFTKQLSAALRNTLYRVDKNDQSSSQIEVDT